jgi:hypothetical protein
VRPIRPLQTRFRSGSGPSTALTCATRSNSPAHSSISTPSPQKGSDCSSAHGFRVFSSPSRGAFHLSLTVLVHYRSSRVFRLGGWSPRLPTGFLVPRGTQVPDHHRSVCFAYGTLTRSGPASQPVRLHPSRMASCLVPAPPGPATPDPQRHQAWHGSGLGSSPFAHHYWGNLG